LPAAQTDEGDASRRLRQALVAQARDRELLAYDMHDGLAQYLAGAVMHLEACDLSRLDDATVTEVTEALRLVRKADAETRRLMGAQRPPALAEAGLVGALEMIMVDARRHGIEGQLTVTVPETAVPPHLAPSMYRIVHEAVANAVQHAAARRVHAVIEPCPEGLRIQVSDDGRGFDPSRVPGERIGLEGIRHRAALFGGTARITSRPGAGATVEIVLPT